MPAIFVRPGVASDASAIYAVISGARSFLASQHIDQWQGSYPDTAAVASDIAAGTNRVLTVNGAVVGTASLITGPDPFYKFIEGKGWQNPDSSDYYVIHRFAIGDSGRGKHLARVFMSNLLSELYARGARDVRIDTHPDNHIMQHVVTSNGFQAVGTVYLDEPVPERLAYQLLMPEPVG